MSTPMLYCYQKNIIDQIYERWDSGVRNILVQLATGGGKTIIMSHVLKQHAGAAIAIAHRQELISQLSITLARNGIRHDLMVSKQIIRNIIALHMGEVGRSYYQPGAKIIAAGIDTLIRRDDSRFKNITLVIQDEAHHVLKSNKWGKAAEMFSAAQGLYLTATPERADGYGLSRSSDGVVDNIIVGPPMRELIAQGFLTDYRIFNPRSNIDLTNVPISAGGDFSPAKLRDAVHKSRIVGDVVESYLKFAAGKLGLTFAADIQSAEEIARKYRECNVSAEIITGKTPDLLRASLMKKFRNREILQLVSVDILGEGVDVPAVEVVSMARPTNSYPVYSQQFGRGLRVSKDKACAMIIDHVDNVHRHGLPDRVRVWSIDRRERRSRGDTKDAILLKTCGNVNCLAVYERVKRVCPYCGFYTPPLERSSPEQVDGDLFELSPEILEKMRGEIKKIDSDPVFPSQANAIVRASIIKRHHARRACQLRLRERITLWGGYYRDRGLSDSEIYRKFYFDYGIDILSAQSLNALKSEDLENKINRTLTLLNIVGIV